MVKLSVTRAALSAFLVLTFAVNHQLHMQARFDSHVDELVNEDAQISDCNSLDLCDLKSTGEELKYELSQLPAVIVLASVEAGEQSVRQFELEASPIAYRCFISIPLPERGPPSVA